MLQVLSPRHQKFQDRSKFNWMLAYHIISISNYTFPLDISFYFASVLIKEIVVL